MTDPPRESSIGPSRNRRAPEDQLHLSVDDSRAGFVPPLTFGNRRAGKCPRSLTRRATFNGRDAAPMIVRAALAPFRRNEGCKAVRTDFADNLRIAVDLQIGLQSRLDGLARQDFEHNPPEERDPPDEEEPSGVGMRQEHILEIRLLC